MEVIQDELYIYARDVNYVSASLATKRQLSESGNSQLSTASSKLTRSKLLATHNNVTKEFEKVSEVPNLTKAVDLDKSNLNQLDTSVSNIRPSKRFKGKKVCELARDLLGVDDLELADINYAKDGLQLDDNVSEDFYEELDKSIDEKKINEMMMENNNHKTGNSSSSVKGVNKCGKGGKSKGQSTRKARVTHSTKFILILKMIIAMKNKCVVSSYLGFYYLFS
ncbi:hypothetical protein F8M41_013557 [Gigaspora margarita]|uniref:Uncharacterized protein n=1 Tax=Gigaspora margarita TaxID=4874 RepID=A0A8H3WWK6_GIGMA|nr:hypothetical protein F8M41_013557 [Gigaspora margarita]